MIPDSGELKKLNKKLNEIGEKLAKAVTEVPEGMTRKLAIGANDIRNTIIQSMRNTPKTGKHYRRGKSGRVHIASSSGNPPAIDYGELVRSIMFDVRPMEIEVGSLGGAPYAVYLEDVTKLNRPFLEPSVRKHQKEIIDNVGEEAFKIIQEGFK